MKQRQSTPEAGISLSASDTAQPIRKDTTISDAGTSAPGEEAPPTQDLTVGGNGKDGTLSVLAADGQPLFQTVRGSVGHPSRPLKHVAARIGGGTVAGVLQLVNREGKKTVHIDGADGGLTLGSQIAMQGRDNQDQIILGARSNRSEMSIGAPERPGRIQLTTGGNPGPTIELDGERNSLLFLTKGSRTDSVLELNGNTAAVRAGGKGNSGNVAVLGSDGQPSVELQGNTATLKAGGNGKDGTVSVRGADGLPLVELLGRSNESVIGLGQQNRPGRISMYSAKGQEAIRLDAAAGDIMLMNADCAEEFDVAVQDVQPGTVMVLTDDGRLAPSSEPYDTRVTGVVSGAGAFRPGLILDRRDTGMPRVPVALMGKVYCWVDATRAAIGVGDLLTTAEVPGHAMKVSDTTRAIGAIIGKALAPLAAGRQLIPILVTAR